MYARLTPNGLALLHRRAFLRDIGSAIGGISLLQLLGRDGLLAAEHAAGFRPAIDGTRPCAARPPQFRAKADQLLRRNATRSATSCAVRPNCAALIIS